MFCPQLSVFHVLNKLLPLTGAHVRVSMPHPIINQDLAAFRLEQYRFTESAERIEANTRSPHPLEDCHQAVTEKALRREHISALGLEEKALLAVTDVIRKHLGKSGVNIDVAIGGNGLQRLLAARLFRPSIRV